MSVAIIYTIISFFLDGIISNYTNINLVDPSYLRTIFSVISLVIIFNYFDNEKKYLTILIPLGIIFDIVYTNTFLLNVVVFLVIYIILKQLDYFIPNNLFTINIKSIISISIYHTVTYIILIITHYNSYPINMLLTIIIRSLIMTIIYTTISYYIIKKIYNYLNIQKIR